MRRRKKEDLFKKIMGIFVQTLSLICLIIIVYIIGRSIIKTSSHSTAKNEVSTEETTIKQEEKTTQSDDIILEDEDELQEEEMTSTTKSTIDKTTTAASKAESASSTRTSQQTRRTTATTEVTTQAEISTKYGPETNQDGNSVDWISEQKDVIELEKDSYELREKGKSGIQYIDANGDVAKVLYQPEDSVDGKSYEEYYYQGNELIYVSVWSADGDGLGEQYYYNKGTLIQWVDGDGLIYNRETRGSGFEQSSDWEKYLSAGVKAMRKSKTSTTDTTDSSSSTDSVTVSTASTTVSTTSTTVSTTSTTGTTSTSLSSIAQ